MGKKEEIFTVPRVKNIIFGNKGKGKSIIFQANIHPCGGIVLPEGGSQMWPQRKKYIEKDILYII